MATHPMTKSQHAVPGMTLDECGKVFGVTRERIRQIEAKALKKLRAYCARNGLKPEDFIMK